MKAQILQLICTVYVDLTSGHQGVQFHYAFWDFCFVFETKQVVRVNSSCAAIATNFRPTILANVGCTTFFSYYCVRDSSLSEIDRLQLLSLWFQTDFKVRLYFFYWINRDASDCIVIAVLYGIDISHKLFTPEVVWPSKSVRGTMFGLCMCTAQLWASVNVDGTIAVSYLTVLSLLLRIIITIDN